MTTLQVTPHRGAFGRVGLGSPPGNLSYNGGTEVTNAAKLCSALTGNGESAGTRSYAIVLWVGAFAVCVGECPSVIPSHVRKTGRIASADITVITTITAKQH